MTDVFVLERCHFQHFASDESNTPRQIRMLIKTGGGDPATGTPEGIHWHMNSANQIEYVAADEKRQIIPYIHVKDMQGHVTEYYAQGLNGDQDQMAKAARRRMDCVDCHNRPTHVYIPPDQAVDQALLACHIDGSLPYIKQQAVSALTGTYKTTEAARESIATEIGEFYVKRYPDLARGKQIEIRNAVTEVRKIYRRTTFPEMKLNWQTHPNNLGHYYSSGCFRCHDGQHVSSQGKLIKKDCDLCHTIVDQQEGGISMVPTPAMNFQHPVDVGDITQANCSDCHTGGVGP